MENKIFKDFDKILPPQRIARLSGREIDVSRIPSRISLEIAQFRDNFLKMNSETMQKRSLEIVAKICQVTDPGITPEWLLDNTHFEQLTDFMDFVLEPINRPAEDKNKKKASQGK